MNRHRVLGELVTFKDAKAFHHDGILYHKRRNRAIIVHVHGSFGNFYQNGFLRVMAQTYLKAGISFLSFNLSGHDALAEGYRNEWDFEYTGSAITDFQRCLHELEAAVDFASSFCPRVILQGHSIGCDRILYYLISRKRSHDFVLLSPCDSYRLQARWIAPETVESQISRLASKKSRMGRWDWLSKREYGIWQGDWRYSIPITRNALLRIMRGPPFKLMRVDRPMNFRLRQRALVYIGGDDTLQTSNRDTMIGYLRERIHRLEMTKYYPEGDHSLWGCEKAVANEIVRWVRTGESSDPTPSQRLAARR